MNRVLTLVCLGTCAAWLSTPAKAQTAAASTSSKASSTKKRTSASHPLAANTSKSRTTPKTASSPKTNVVPLHRTASSASKHKAGARKRSAAPSYQLHPDPERYTQIQKALADRGYFKGSVDGTWGDDSVDAMRHFQTDQKLEPDGKITAPALIGLGLGPVHDGRTGHDVEAPPPAPATEVAPGQTPPAGADSDEEPPSPER